MCLCDMGCGPSSCLGAGDGSDVSEHDPKSDFQSNLVRKRSAESFLENYEQGKVLGSGITGQVRVVKNKLTGVEYAMKTINLDRVDKAQLKELRNEIKILSQLDHPNIVRLYECFEDERTMYLIMELCIGGELAQRKLTKEGQVVALTSQLLSAIAYCHKRGVVHRDIKLENIIFVNDERTSPIKLIDFGLSTTFSLVDDNAGSTQAADRNFKPNFGQSRLFLTTCGTAHYMAPEVIKGNYAKACDLWSVGVLVFMLLTGRPPFDGPDEATVFRRLQAGKASYSHPVWGKASPHAKSLVQRLLVVDPGKRLSAEDALKSPWFKRYHASRSFRAGAKIEIEVVESLRKYASYSKLKKAALMVIAHNHTSEEVEELRKAFIAVDIDRTGTITFEELSTLMKKHESSGDESEIRALFDDLDIDKSGEIRYNEFLAATLEAKCALDENMWMQAFNHLDEDDSGYITAENLEKLLGKAAYSKDAISRIIDECDITRDGKISKDEFLQLCRDQELKVVARLESSELDAADGDEVPQADEEAAPEDVMPAVE